MIRFLLLLQFPLLYCVSVVLGLIVYGSDFDEITGQLYLIPLLLIPALHFFKKQFYHFLSNTGVIAIVLVTGLLSALLVYSQLHFAYWDEHNMRQAALLAVLGICSYLASVVAANRILQDATASRQQSQRFNLSMALLVIAGSWLLSAVFPMANIFVIAGIMLTHLMFYMGFRGENLSITIETTKVSFVFQYLIFLIIMQLGLVIWDYQVDTDWGVSLFVAFVCAALVAGMAEQLKQRLFVPVAVITIFNFIVTVVWPEFVISIVNSALVGACLGWVLSSVLHPSGRLMPHRAVGLTWTVFLGLVFGYLFYANLEFASYRLILLLPPLILLFFNTQKDVSKNTAT